MAEHPFPASGSPNTSMLLLFLESSLTLSIAVSVSGQAAGNRRRLVSRWPLAINLPIARFAGSPLGNPCAKGDNHSSVAPGAHELYLFQCHLDTLL